MTGETGHWVYMAPEALTIQLWLNKIIADDFSKHCLSYDLSLMNLKLRQLLRSHISVVRQNLRPEIPRCCPSSLANVMKRCWDANPDRRPEMDEVVSMLESIDTSKGGGMIPHDQPQGCLCFQRYRDLDIFTLTPH
ncbi:serine/threonine-protein kinase STY13-like [Hibiscus syriacus]|uniref:serine/threonine-protein kinase STY13-like n=1 Tax=Hibiscus syriacus TaxID=106335 RepID=UPI001923BF76|nr:serine/threonine-protein kinase STY13-like [Hibiscus syriacus]